MHFYSTNNKKVTVTLKEAVTRGLAPDHGLYMPLQIQPMAPTFFDDLSKLSDQAIAYEITNHLIGNDVPHYVIEKIIAHTVTFETPLVQLEKNIWALELFHGPTLAFKDFGARFMAALLGYFAREEGREFTILVATSGDTGSAVAHGFYNVPGIKVIVLYPSGKVSDLQEKQFTTLGDNISALEIQGTFDDCQRLVKTAFQDHALSEKLNLTSANSINIARLIPQSFYYFFSMAKMPKDVPVVFCVPSGNFGNLTGGILAQRLGLPIKHFIAATNANDVVPQYLASNNFVPRPSIQTISNAMDVGDPSNFVRLLDLFDNNYDQFSKSVSGYAFDDESTRGIMKAVYNKSGYILDPHGAVGYLGLERYLSTNKKLNGVFLETAHPGKFKDVVEEVIGKPVVLPDRLATFLKKEKKSLSMSNQFEDLKEYLLT